MHLEVTEADRKSWHELVHDVVHSSYSKHWTDALKSRLEITAAPAEPTEYINKTVHKPTRELENDAGGGRNIP